jgi:nucleoside-diphosphate-sugar epimerase
LNALVTGGAGFIGSSICRLLLEHGWYVRVFDNLVTGFEENVPPSIELIRGDLRDLEAVQVACREIDVVFHQGAVRSVPRSVEDPQLSNETNVAGTLNILLAAEEAGAHRVIYASSSSVYGDVNEAVNREFMTPNPQSPYAVTKLAGEYYCRVWSRLKGLSTVSLRYFNVFGPGQNPESRYAAVFPAFISALVKGHPPELHWDGNQSRDFTYVEDVARANLFAAQADSRIDGQVINIGAGDPRTVNEVLEAVSRAIGRWIDPVLRPKRPGDVRRTHADITQARLLLGWEPEANWRDAVAATVGWLLERASLSGLLTAPRR